jgi:hypothetical protein
MRTAAGRTTALPFRQKCTRWFALDHRECVRGNRPRFRPVNNSQRTTEAPSWPTANKVRPSRLNARAKFPLAAFAPLSDSSSLPLADDRTRTRQTSSLPMTAKRLESGEKIRSAPPRLEMGACACSMPRLASRMDNGLSSRAMASSRRSGDSTARRMPAPPSLNCRTSSPLSADHQVNRFGWRVIASRPSAEKATRASGPSALRGKRSLPATTSHRRIDPSEAPAASSLPSSDQVSAASEGEMLAA